MVIKTDHPGGLINLRHLNLVLPLAHRHDMRFVLLRLAGRRFDRHLEKHLQFAKNVHDPVGGDLGRRFRRRTFGGRIRRGRGRHEPKNISRDNQRVGVAGIRCHGRKHDGHPPAEGKEA